MFRPFSLCDVQRNRRKALDKAMKKWPQPPYRDGDHGHPGCRNGGYNAGTAYTAMPMEMIHSSASACRARSCSAISSGLPAVPRSTSAA